LYCNVLNKVRIHTALKTTSLSTGLKRFWLWCLLTLSSIVTIQMKDHSRNKNEMMNNNSP
jgi:hypothetical protein